MPPKRKVGPRAKAAQMENVTVRKTTTTETSKLASLMDDFTKNEGYVSPNADLTISNGNMELQSVPEIISVTGEGPTIIISDEDNEEFLPKKKITKPQNENKIKKIRKRAAFTDDPINTNEIVVMKSNEHNVQIKKKKNNKKAATNEDDDIPMEIVKNTKTKKTTKRVENGRDNDIIQIGIEIVQEEPLQEEEEPLQEKPKYKRGAKQDSFTNPFHYQELLANFHSNTEVPVELPVQTKTRGVKEKQIVDKPKATSSKPKKNLKSQKSEENDSDIEDQKPKRGVPKSKQGIKSSDDSSGNNDLSDSERPKNKLQVNFEQTAKPKRGGRRVKDKELNENDLMKSPPSLCANDGENIKTDNLPDGLPDNPESGKQGIKPKPPTAVKRKTKAKPAKK